MFGHLCHPEVSLQKCLCTKPPARHGGKSGSNRSRGFKLKQLSPTRGTALSLRRSLQGLALVLRTSKKRPRARQTTEPARSPGPPGARLARPPPGAPAVRPRPRGEGGGRARSPPRGAPTPSSSPGEAPRAGVRIRGEERRPTCRESVRRRVRGSPRRGDPRALEAPGAPLPVPALAPERPYLYSRSLTWSDL